MADPSTGWITLGRVVRPRGNRGEVMVESLTSHQERFEPGTRLHLWAPGAQEPVPLEVEESWDHQGRLVLKFAGVDSISDADRWRGAEIRIPAEERLPAPEGEYYHADLIGCRIIDQATAEEWGEVVGCQETGGPLLLEVAVAGREDPVLVPFVRAICRGIDVEARRIEAILPEGLKEL